MCGVIGTTKTDLNIANATAGLSHRGPDGRGSFSQGKVSFGHCRLAIIDLSQGSSQPMSSSDGSAVITFNGEIYNYKEVRSDLEKMGCKFKSSGDTEVILQGYQKMGTGIFKRLRGMWALAIYDSRNENIVLSRDSFGIKPLYYSIKGDELSFASELRSVIEMTGLNEPDAQIYHQYFNLGYFIAPDTGYKGIRKLLPGQILTWDVSGRKISESSILQPDQFEDAGQTSVAHTMKDALEDTVRAHFVSDVPVGILFSGGNDSTLLAAISKKLGYDPVAYHMAIKGSLDTEYARKSAKVLGLKLKEFTLTQEELVRQYEKVWSIMDELTADVSIIPTSLIFEHIKGEAKVVLGGDGGDEIFGGYDRQSLLSKHSRIIQGQDLASKMRSLAGTSSFALSRLNPILNRLERLALDSGLKSDLISAYLKTVKIADMEIGTNKIRKALAEIYTTSRLKNIVPSSLFFDQTVYLPNDLMVKTDISSMASSIEARVPFLDKSLFRYVSKNIYSKPEKWDLLKGKQLLKKELKAYLPAELAERPKKGFGIPFSLYGGEFFRNDLVKALAFHKDHKKEFGMTEKDPEIFEARLADIILRKYPRFAFALVGNWKRFR